MPPIKKDLSLQNRGNFFLPPGLEKAVSETGCTVNGPLLSIPMLWLGLAEQGSLWVLRQRPTWFPTTSAILTITVPVGGQAERK